MKPSPISQIDVPLLKLAASSTSTTVLAAWVSPLQASCLEFGIDTIREVSSYIANLVEESGGFTKQRESLNYSAEALKAKFGRHRISLGDCVKYGRTKDHSANQEMLANLLYGGEFGIKNLGNVKPGDGWFFRGAGPTQTTGRGNMQKLADHFGIPLEKVPDFLCTPVGGARGAGFFWKSHDLDAKAATPGVEDDREAINGGLFGIDNVRADFDHLIAELIRRGC